MHTLQGNEARDTKYDQNRVLRRQNRESTHIFLMNWITIDQGMWQHIFLR